jgi:hypothetical protein
MHIYILHALDIVSKNVFQVTAHENEKAWYVQMIVVEQEVAISTEIQIVNI